MSGQFNKAFVKAFGFSKLKDPSATGAVKQADRHTVVQILQHMTEQSAPCDAQSCSFLLKSAEHKARSQCDFGTVYVAHSSLEQRTIPILDNRFEVLCSAIMEE